MSTAKNVPSSSQLNYVWLLHQRGASGSLVAVSQANLELSHCVIGNLSSAEPSSLQESGTGLHLTAGAKATVTGCEFHKNLGHGITADDNNFSGNQSGDVWQEPHPSHLPTQI